ncbi:exodeoxyribonuclease VII large subunit, partial [Enterococcus faecalis]|uniref:exodeoxyribonuclease VII large subunit n=2 Tax=Lactobacillales TaxID=186826 RepID=UPI00254CA091
ITTVRRRYPIVEIVIYPTVVQGDRAKDSIVSNLKRADQTGSYDVIIVGRGGGSIEDLWCFNEEEVARTIAACQTPV